MRLTVGITHLTPSWRIVLEQIAPPFEELNNRTRWTLENYTCIIVTSPLRRGARERLVHFVSNGGGVLMETDAAEQTLGIRSEPAFVDYIDTSGDDMYGDVSPGFIGRTLHLPSGGALLKEKHDRRLVQVVTIGRGEAIILPGGLLDSVTSSGCRRRNFPSEGPWLPSERVAKVSKRTVREIVHRSLQELFWKRELPFVSLSPFPDGADSIFGFRIDTDFASKEAVKLLYELCRKHDISATWFVETGSSAEWIYRYAEMDNQEIGLHCFKHRISKNYTLNEADMRRGISILKNAGVTPAGYSAPFGEWNTALSKAMEHRHFGYSSEFALDYDNLPFYPSLGERHATVLQVPIHPIATDSLRNARHRSDEMKTYFGNVIEDHVASRLPLLFYDHPANADLEVLDWLFTSVRGMNVPVMTFGEYADWWETRRETGLTAQIDNGILQLSADGVDESVKVIVSQMGGRHLTAEKNGAVKLNEAGWTTSQARPVLKPHIAVRHGLNRKMIFNDILHHYWKRRL